MSIYDHEVKDAQDNIVQLSDFKGKTLIIVNTASKCGLTGHYEGLENLYEKYKDQGLEILGFPCNQFGGQEPGSDSEIQEFCKMKFDIKFPVYKKIDVNGQNAHPLYQYLKEKAPGILNTKKIKWNFTKFLISKDGQKVQRFAPTTKPEDIEQEIIKLL